MRQFERGSGDGAQFWHVELKDNTVTVVYGPKGTPGRRQVWEYNSAAQAEAQYERKIKGKQDDGYLEVGTESPPPLRRALEDALAEQPDNMANHMAYADWLTEQGDPLGEFIQVQLRREADDFDEDECHRLEARERELLTRHGVGWLGDLTRFLYGTKNCETRFARGWLDSLRIKTLTRPFAGAIASSPQVRLLRELAIDDLDREERVVEGRGLGLLALSAYLGNVRRLRIGRQPDEEGFTLNNHQHFYVSPAGLVVRMPRLEELRINVPFAGAEELFGMETFTELRVLEYNFGTHYPLEALAHNRALGNVRHLLFHAQPMVEWNDAEGYGNFSTGELTALCKSKYLQGLTHLRLHGMAWGDTACEVLASSGIFRRLKVLDLAYGWITDHGARILARCKDLKHLDELNLSHNSVSRDGIQALRATGVRVRAVRQRDPDEPAPRDRFDGPVEN